ncbi:Nuclear transcription factor Y subunit A [Babesia duncani]|uniref:Nuclear transcription factor Y subunit A n=1 Tax=Babesia duncani TaxID=323732 RepID=A0AAD9PJM6_9APIC|nr:Nuclear transcription factor Y subunit A [Babesia duncani]
MQYYKSPSTSSQSSDSYWSKYVLYVDPRQYDRVLQRRIQRDRMLMRKGRPKGTYLTVAVHDEPAKAKESLETTPTYTKPPVHTGHFQQFQLGMGYGSPMHATYPEKHYYTANDANFADIATLISATLDPSYSAETSVVSGCTAYTGTTEASPSIARCDPKFYMSFGMDHMYGDYGYITKRDLGVPY